MQKFSQTFLSGIIIHFPSSGKGETALKPQNNATLAVFIYLKCCGEKNVVSEKKKVLTALFFILFVKSAVEFL